MPPHSSAALPCLALLAGLASSCADAKADPPAKPDKGVLSPLGPLPISHMPKVKVRLARPRPVAAAKSRHAMFRGGPARLGRVAAKIPIKRPSVRWRFRTGRAIYSSPVLDSAGRVFAGSLDGHLYAVNPKGKLLWKANLDGPVFSSPAVSRGAVIVGSDGGTLFSLAAATGKVNWRVKPGVCAAAEATKIRGFGPERTRCHLDGSPLIGPDGTIYLASDALYAFSPAGTRRWLARLGGHAFSSVTLDPAGDRLFVGTQRAGLYALSGAGKQLWRIKAKWDIDSTPVATPGGLLLAGGDDGRLRAVSPESGEEQWQAKLRWAVRSSPAVAHDGTILVGCDDRHLYALDGEGQVKWRFSTKGRVRSSPVVDRKGTVLFGSQDDHLYALDSEGKIRWKLKLGGDVDSSPTVGPDGTIYVGADDGVLYALR